MLMLIRLSCACISWAVIASSLYVNTTICMRLAAQLMGLSCPHQDEAHEDDRHVVFLLLNIRRSLLILIRIQFLRECCSLYQRTSLLTYCPPFARPYTIFSLKFRFGFGHIVRIE